MGKEVLGVRPEEKSVVPGLLIIAGAGAGFWAFAKIDELWEKATHNHPYGDRLAKQKTDCFSIYQALNAHGLFHGGSPEERRELESRMEEVAQRIDQIEWAIASDLGAKGVLLYGGKKLLPRISAALALAGLVKLARS